MKMTKDDFIKVDELHEKIDDLLVGNGVHVGLHTLCSVIAGAGIGVRDKANKQEFMADVHECISTFYDYYLEAVEGSND